MHQFALRDTRNETRRLPRVLYKHIFGLRGRINRDKVRD